MAYDSQFLRFTWGFTIAGTDEGAQTGLNLKAPGVWTGAVASLTEIRADAALQQLYITRMATLMGNAQVQWADYGRLNSIRIGAVGTDGIELDSPVIADDLTPAAGTVAGSVLPQSSICCSLRSGLTTGSGNNGRMYLPYTSFSLVPGSPDASSTSTSAVATAFRIFINAIVNDTNDTITTVVQPFIMTQVAGHTSKQVTEIRVGDITDTQRRRRNQLPEIYSTLSIPT